MTLQAIPPVSVSRPALGQVPLSSFWMSLWAACTALAWLLPNHYPPWTTFHLDAWMACVMLTTAAWLQIKVRVPVPWTGLPALVAVVSVVPVLQYAAGLVVQAGNAWVSSAYLLGFLLAWLGGARWEAGARGQLGDGLFLAIGLAAFVSVGLALHQWLLLDRLDIWSMGGGAGRPFANLGQPNQLATLLVWGLLALAWAYVRRQIGSHVAIFAATYLLFGMALTGSRTAWVAMALLVMAAWLWRRAWPNARAPWAVTGLAVYFFVCVVSVNPLSRLLLGDVSTGVADVVRVASESRLTIWALFLDASTHQPWFGYGWNQVAMAHMDTALDHPALHVYFTHAHNFFLDLVLWCGWPLGLVASAYLLWWIVSRARRVRGADDAVLFLMVLVIANHAMLELPLHHAYFLLPVGLVMGALDLRLAVAPVYRGARWLDFAVWLVAAALLALIIRDYARVEPSYQTLRFEWARIKTSPAKPPDVVVLTQWRDYVAMAKTDLGKAVSDEELQRMENITSLYPNTGFFQVLAMSLARRGQTDRAAHWLDVMCSVLSVAQCGGVRAAWIQQAAQDPALAAVPWPRATKVGN